MKSRNLLSLLFIIMMSLSVACNKPAPEPKPEPKPQPKEQLSITVSPSAVSLFVGKSQQLIVTLSPNENKLTPSYLSKTPTIATVTDKGLVTGIAVGETTIVVKAGDATKEVPVQVKEAPIQVPQEMPLLKFGIPRNDYEKIEDEEVIAYEAKLGRTQQEVDYRPSGFKGDGLTTIPAVVYGIPIAGDADLILAYGKESITDCKRTKAMLYELGFTRLEETTVSNYLGDKRKGLRAVCDTDPSITASLMDIPNKKLGTTMFIEFAKRQFEDMTVTTKHAILPDVKDFPSLEKLATKDPFQINAFEEALGLRTFRAGESPRTTHILYRTVEDKVPDTNLEFVFYIAPTEPDAIGFIITELLCISNERDLRSKEFQNYLKANGFDKNYNVSEEAVLTVNNKDGVLCKVNLVRIAQEQYVYQMYLFPPAHK